MKTKSYGKSLPTIISGFLDSRADSLRVGPPIGNYVMHRFHELPAALKDYRDYRENGERRDNPREIFPAAGVDTLKIKSSIYKPDGPNKEDYWPDKQGRYWWCLSLDDGRVSEDYYWVKDEVRGYPDKADSNQYWFTVHHAPSGAKIEGFSSKPDRLKGYPDKEGKYWSYVQYDECGSIKAWMEEKDRNYLKRIKQENPALYEGYSLRLMSNLPNKDKAKEGVIYLCELSQTCVLRDLRGNVREIMLPESIDLSNLSSKLKNSSFMVSILALTSRRGYTLPFAPKEVAEINSASVKGSSLQTQQKLSPEREQISNPPSIMPPSSGEITFGQKRKQKELTTDDSLSTIRGHLKRVNTLAVMSNGWLLSGDADGTIKCWQINEQGQSQCLSSWKAHSNGINTLAVLRDKWILSGGKDKTIKCWELNNQAQTRCIATLEGHTGSINKLLVLPNALIASASSDKTIKLWKMNDQGEVRGLLSWEADPLHVSSLVILPNSTWLISGGYDKLIKCWEMDEKNNIHCSATWSGHNDAITTLATLPNRVVLSGSADCTIRFWQVNEQGQAKCLSILTEHTNPIVALAVLSNGLILSGNGNNIKCWELSEQGEAKRIAISEGHSELVSDLVSLPNKLVVSSSLDGTIKCWWNFQIKLKDIHHSSSISKEPTSINIPPYLIPPAQKHRRIEEKSNVRVIPRSELISKQELGRGAFGAVYKADWVGAMVAVKELLNSNLNPRAVTEFFNEVAVMADVRHPNVVSLYGISTEPYSLVMEFLANGSLRAVLDSATELSWPLRYMIVLETAKGLAFLHRSLVLHRDLKSLNILLDEHFKPKLADFGLSATKKSSSATYGANAAGTLAWMAPELFIDTTSRYTAECDVYSYGVVVWEVATRAIPYKNLASSHLIAVHVMQGKRETFPDNSPDIFRRIGQACWEKLPAKRPKLSEVIELLEKTPVSAPSASSGVGSSTLFGAASSALFKMQKIAPEKPDQAASHFSSSSSFNPF